MNCFILVSCSSHDMNGLNPAAMLQHSRDWNTPNMTFDREGLSEPLEIMVSLVPVVVGEQPRKALFASSSNKLLRALRQNPHRNHLTALKNMSGLLLNGSPLGLSPC